MSLAAGSNPFVGLRPFESDESLLFFGRQDQTLDLLERLHEHHFLAVIGGSGSGKSSLVRAGLVPRLQAGYLVNECDRWAIAVMKPGQTPVLHLIQALLAEPLLGGTTTPDALGRQIAERGAEAIFDLLQPLWTAKANLFLLVDQFEELFRFALHRNDTEKKDEAKEFVNLLLALAGAKERPIYVVTTMRSDFLGDCAQILGLPEAMNKSQYLVPRLNREQLRNAIEGPVRLYKGKITAALVARLLNEAQLVTDALPLLQHALMRMWDYEENVHQDGQLDIDDYESKTIGGIEKALSNHADEAMQGLTAEELAITRRMFQALTTIDEHGRKIRRPARLSELVAITGAYRETLLAIIRRFVEDNRSFLIISSIPGTGDQLLDISHESLIRQWSTLSGWVDEEADANRVFTRLTESAALYRKGNGELLIGNELQRVSEWFVTFHPSVAWAQRYSPDAETIFGFFRESETNWKALQAEKERQVRQKRRHRQLLLAALVVVILLISGFAYMVYRNNKENKRQLALNYWNASQAAREDGDRLGSLHFAAEALVFSNDSGLRRNLLIDMEPVQPAARLQTILPAADIINTTAFAPGNKTIAMAGNDGTVRIVNLATWKTEKTFVHEGPANSVAFSPDGKQLFSGSNDSTARLWDVETGAPVHTFRHASPVTFTVFSRDGYTLLTAGVDGYLRFWDKTSGRQTDSLNNGSPVSALAFTAGGDSLFTGGTDGTIRLWNLQTKKQTDTFTYRGPIIAVDVSRDGTHFLTASRDSSILIWELPSKSQVRQLHLPSLVKDAVFSRDGSTVLSAGGDGYIRFWDAALGRQTNTALQHDGPVFSLVLTGDGYTLATTGWDKLVKLWQMTDAKTVRSDVLLHAPGSVTTAVYSEDGATLAYAFDETVQVWEVGTRRSLPPMIHGGIVKSLAFNRDGAQLVTTCDDGILRLWDVPSASLRDSLPTQSYEANAVFSPNGQIISTGNNQQRVIIVATAPLRIINSFSMETPVLRVAVDQRGKKMAIGNKDAAFIFDAKTKKQLAEFKHQNTVSDVQFSRDGNTLLTGSYDFKSRLWDIAGKKQIGQAMPSDGALKSVAFSANDKWIATTSFDGTLRLWDAVTQKPLGDAMMLSDRFNSAVFDPVGTTIVTAGVDSSLRRWPIGADLDIPASLFQLQAKALTGTELNLTTGETQTLPLDQWQVLKRSYDDEAKEHYRHCQYRRFNQWRRFYPADAERVP